MSLLIAINQSYCFAHYAVLERVSVTLHLVKFRHANSQQQLGAGRVTSVISKGVLTSNNRATNNYSNLYKFCSAHTRHKIRIETTTL